MDFLNRHVRVEYQKMPWAVVFEWPIVEGTIAPAKRNGEISPLLRAQGMRACLSLESIFRMYLDWVSVFWIAPRFVVSVTPRIELLWVIVGQHQHTPPTLIQREWRLFACSSVQLTNANVHNGFIGQHKQQLSSRLQRVSNDVAKWHLCFKRTNRSGQFSQRRRPANIHHSGNRPVSAVRMATLWNASTTMGGK